MRAPKVYNYLPVDVNDDDDLMGYYEPDEPAIYIRETLKDRATLETAIHETLHHLFPKLSESRVENYGVIIGDVLWKLKYRRRAK